MPTQKNDTVRIIPAGMPTVKGENIFWNCFPETVENPLTGTKRVYCVKRRGLTSTYIDHSGTVSGETRGVFYWAATGYTYFVFNDKVYDYNGSSVTARITLTSTTGTVGFCEAVYGLKKYLFIADGKKGYLIDKDTPTVVTTVDNTMVVDWVLNNAGTGYTPAGTYNASFSGGGGTGVAATYVVSASGTITSISITNYGSGYTSAPAISFPVGGVGQPSAGSGAAATMYLSVFPVDHIPMPVFMDGFIFLAKKGTSEVYNSDLGDYKIWSAGQYIEAAQFVGDITALTKQQNYILAMKKDSIEYLYNAGNATGSPLARTQQAITQYGCYYSDTVVTVEDDIYFVGSGTGGGYGVWKVNGFKETKVSTEWVDQYLNERFGLFTATVLSQHLLVGSTVRLDGHSFYVLRERSGNTNVPALVYDIGEKFWSLWSSAPVGGSTLTFNGVFSTIRNGKPYFLTNNGKVVTFSDTSAQGSYNDLTSVYYSFYNTPITDMDNRYRKRFNRIEVVGDNYSYSNPVYINYSDDDLIGYPVLSNTSWSIEMRSGPYQGYVNNLGSSRSRLWQIKHTSDAPMKYEAIELFYTQGVN
jgi:hypothetical protein